MLKMHHYKDKKESCQWGKRNLSCCLLNVTRNYKMFVIALKRTRKTSNEFYFVETNYRSPLISFQPFDLDSVFGSIKAGFVLCSKYLKLTYSATEKTFLIVDVYSVKKRLCITTIVATKRQCKLICPNSLFTGMLFVCCLFLKNHEVLQPPPLLLHTACSSSVLQVYARKCTFLSGTLYNGADLIPLMFMKWSGKDWKLVLTNNLESKHILYLNKRWNSVLFFPSCCHMQCCICLLCSL